MPRGAQEPRCADPAVAQPKRKNFCNICFVKIEVRVIMLPVDGIGIGHARTAAGAATGSTWATAGFGGGIWPGKGNAEVVTH